MLRYHKQVFFDPKDLDRLKAFTEALNSLKWAYTEHSLNNIKYRAINIEGLLLFIRDLTLKHLLTKQRLYITVML